MALYKDPTDPDMPKCPRYSTKNHEVSRSCRRKLFLPQNLKKKTDTTRVYLLLSSRSLRE